MNIGNAYLNLDKLLVARNYLQEALEYSKENKILSTLLDSYIRLSHINIKLDYIEYAKEQLLRAEGIIDSLEDERAEGDIRFLNALLFIREEKFSEAADCLQSILDIFIYKDDMNYYYSNILLIHLQMVQNQIIQAKLRLTELTKEIVEYQNLMLIYLFQFEEGYLNFIEGYAEMGMEKMKEAVHNLILRNEIWEVYRVSKLFADLIIRTYPEEAKRYYNLSFEYYQKLSYFE